MISDKFWIFQCAFWISGIIFSLPMEKRENFNKRAIVSSAIFVIVAVLFQVFLPVRNLYIEVLCRDISYILMVLFIYSCWEISATVAIYNMVWGVSVWQVTKEFCNAVVVLQAKFLPNQIIEDVIIVLFFVLCYVVCGITIAKWMPKGRKNKMGPRQISLTLLIFLLLNVLSFNEILRLDVVIDSEWKYLYLAQCVCLVLLYLEGEMFKKSDMRQEMEIMNLLHQKEREQYFLAKENIELINQKCHDLKHQIRVLRKGDKEELDKYLKEIEDSVEIYEAIVKTGNEVFDTILTEKSLYCHAKQIQVNCVADGSQMDFIDTIDLYAILGNAMDNAIEAVEQFKEPEKRQLDVMIYRQQCFLVIHIMNPIPQALIYEEGLPVTTKADKGFHGFGLRSIRHIIKKYEGFMNVAEEDGCFSLKLLIPIPTTEKTTT